VNYNPVLYFLLEFILFPVENLNVVPGKMVTECSPVHSCNRLVSLQVFINSGYKELAHLMNIITGKVTALHLMQYTAIFHGAGLVFGMKQSVGRHLCECMY